MGPSSRPTPSKVLALGAHPDDIELGCGGSLARFRDEGSELHSAVFSTCGDETPADSKLRAREYAVAAKSLGVKRPVVSGFPPPSLFIDITGTLDRKLDALRRYKSQFGRRAYFDEESFRSLARTRGAQSGYSYAEGFVVYKMFW